MKFLRRFIPLFTIVILLIHKNAYAYLDPGTGSYILQIVIAAILGAFFLLKSYWGRLKIFFVSLFSKSKGD